MKQRTLKKEIIFSGIGVHLGLPSNIILKPSPCNSGIIFVNPKFLEEKLEIGKIIPEEAIHASVIKSSNWMVSTVEHLMAVISAFYIDNLIVEVSGIEIPIFDGSALNFVDGIKRVGCEQQDDEKYFLTPKQELNLNGTEGRMIQILPAQFCKNSRLYDKNLYFDYMADFEHSLIGKSKLNGKMSTEFFLEHIAPARTFGFLEQLPFLRRHGLAKGTTLGNTVVIGEEEFLNDRRFEDEFVRHKFLDLLGDLALLGKNLAGSIKAQKTGHNFNRLVVQHYINNPDMWKLI